MRKLTEEILYDRRPNNASLALKTGLRLLESIYGAFTTARNFFYDKNLKKTKSLPCRVISIGNLTVGGTGKTPVVILTAKILRDAGYPVAVVSRGYRGSAGAPLVVSDGSEIGVSPQDSGDEPHIVAYELPGIPVVVGKDRYRAAKIAYDNFKPRIILLDDAFQHRRLHRNIDIVTIDAGNPYGNEHLLPRGILRESPYSLKRARAVIITRYRDEIGRDRLERMVRFYNHIVPIFFSRHVPVGLHKPGGRDRIDLEILSGKRTAALSNIANPESFHNMLGSLGVELVYKKISPDHHRYSVDELQDIEKKAIEAGAEKLVMTAKDERNLPEEYKIGTIETLVLDIEAVLVDNQEEYLKIIKPAYK